MKVKDGLYIGVQAKAYGPDSTLTFTKLGTFLGGRDFLKAKNPENSCLLVHTPETRFERRLAVALKNNVLANVSSVELAYSTREATPPVSDEIQDESGFVLRPHQERALADLLTVDYTHGLYVSPCGSGKTVVAGRVLAAKQAPLVVVASPLQSSAAQNMERLAPFVPDYKTVRAWSDANGTDPSFLEAAVAVEKDEKVFVSTTYDTLPVVVAALKKTGAKPLLIVDEAHNLPTYKDVSDEANDELWECVYYAEKSLLMTATPSATIREKNEDIQVVHHYKFCDAIRDGVITDYNIFIPELTTTDNVPVEIVGDAETVAKACFLVSGMLESGARRCIVYCESKEKCRLFNETFVSACSEYFGVRPEVQSITCDDSDKKRKKVLKNFSKAPAFMDPDPESGHRQIVLNIVTSVRILDEAIDIPECDSVFLTRLPKSNNSAMSSTRSVQRLCRAVRTHPSKTTAKVFIWTDPKDCTGIIKTFKLLRRNDPAFADKFKCVAKYYDKKHEEETIKKVEMTLEEFKKNYVVKAVDAEEAWEEKYALYLEYQELFPGELTSFTVYKGVKLGHWRMNQRANYINGKASMTADRIKKLEAIPDWKWNEDEFEKRIRIYNECLDSIRPGDEIPKVYEGNDIQGWMKQWKAHYKLKDQEGHHFFQDAERLGAYEELVARVSELTPLDSTMERTHALCEFINNLKEKFKGHVDFDIAGSISQKGDTHNGLPVGVHFYYIRDQYKKGRLTKDHFDYINKAVPDFPWEDGLFDDVANGVSLWNKFINENGRPPNEGDTVLNYKGSQFNFKNWISRMKKKMDEGKLTDKQKNDLASLQGLPPLKRQRAKRQTFQTSLEEYKAEVARGARPGSNDKLGKWLSNQKAELSSKRNDPSVQDKVKGLESIPGFNW